MEGLGKKFQEARRARNITLDEAGRLTKIRPSRLAEIENEDFSQFPSLAYAKGFLLIYGKFLDVDVSQYLEAFETSEHVSVDGYAYLQDNPAPIPTRPIVVRRSSGERNSFVPLLIGVLAIVIGFWVLKLVMNVQRVKPGTQIGIEMTPTPPPGRIAAPRALPVGSTTPPATRTAADTPARVATPLPATPTPLPISTPLPTTIPTAQSVEPEVRRAEPVKSSDLAAAAAANSPSSFSGGIETSVEIRPLKKTYLKVAVDDADPTERWISASDKNLKFSGHRIAIRVLDSTAVEIKKNGKKITTSDAEVKIE